MHKEAPPLECHIALARIMRRTPLPHKLAGLLLLRVCRRAVLTHLGAEEMLILRRQS